jgi:hypothetical protein
MKKTFLLIAALLMMGSAAFAGGGFDIAIGPKVGFQTAKLSYEKADIKAGFANHFTAGLFGRVTIGRLYVQPEVLYFKTSNLFDVNVTGEDEYFNIPTGANVNLTLNQMNLQVPVLIGVNILDLDLLTLRAQVGPTANFVLKSQTLIDYTVSATGSDGSQMTQEGNVSSDSDQFNTKTISWGLQAGLGVDVWRFTLDVNYNFGLSKVFGALNDTPLGETFDFTNVDNTKQNLFMVTVGFKLL